MKAALKFPKIDLEELGKEMESNRKQRLEFAKQYAEWVKKTPNKVWSTQQKVLLDQ